MSALLLVPLILGVLSLALIAIIVLYAPKPHAIDNVILFARKIAICDLESLLDPATEWNLRRSLEKRALAAAQEDRMRLAREYLRRLSHNASLIHLWVLREQEQIESRKREDYTERDLLVIEILQLAIDVRLYSLAASLRMGLWMALKAHRWPMRFLPSLPGLRVQSGIDVVEKYRRLTERAVVLAARHGEVYRERLLQALTS
jgi:hypothetical protein